MDLSSSTYRSIERAIASFVTPTRVRFHKSLLLHGSIEQAISNEPLHQSLLPLEPVSINLYSYGSIERATGSSLLPL
eukprot:scaffold12043_cov73-Cylindrotheca_fusiformis.AAC.1